MDPTALARRPRLPPRPLVALVVVALAACARDPEATRRQAGDDNRDRHDAAVDRELRSRALTRLELPVTLVSTYAAAGSADYPTVAASPLAGLRDGEALVRVPIGPGDATGLGLLAATCVSGGSCGCDLSQEFVGARRSDGRTVILRVHPVAHTRTVTRPGTCASGCGTEAPPEPLSLYTLPVATPAQVELIDVPYAYDRVIVTCEHPMPAP